MSIWKAALAGVAVVLMTPFGSEAQTGSPFAPLPSAATTAVPVSAVPGVVPGVAPTKSIWSCLGLTSANLAACRAKLCASQFGLLLDNMMKPMSGLTGGVIPSFCPPVGPSDLNNPAGGPGSAQSVANKIKKNEAEAKARVAAVEYLGTVDCHYWPDAEAALIQSLRTDRNECVRFAAARVLGSGCCCTKNTMAALILAVTASGKDGNPSETSDRVRAAAYASLKACECRYTEPPQQAPERPTVPLEPISPERPQASFGRHREILLTSFYTRDVPSMSWATVLADARIVLAKNTDASLGRVMLPTGQRNVYNALVRASVHGNADQAAAADREPRPPQPVVNSQRPAPSRIPPPAIGTAPASPRPDRAVAPAAYRPPTPQPAAYQPQPSPARDRSLLGILMSTGRSRGATN